MDADPELDITLSNGRRVVTYQIAALDRDLRTWTVDEPLVSRRVILGDAAALDTRRRLEVRVAARLAEGWCRSTRPRERRPRRSCPISASRSAVCSRRWYAADWRSRLPTPAASGGRRVRCCGSRRGASASTRRTEGSIGPASRAGSARWRRSAGISRRRSSMTAPRWRRTRGSASRAGWHAWRRRARVRAALARWPATSSLDSIAAADRAMEVVVPSQPEPRAIEMAVNARHVAVRVATRIAADPAQRRGAIARAVAEWTPLKPTTEKTS